MTTNLSARGLENLVTALNEELKGFPPGQARNEKLRDICRARMAQASSPKEKLFWEGMLQQFGGT